MSKDAENVKEFYTNDVVYRFDKKKKIVFGVVADSYNYEASSDISDSPLEKGQIRVLWHNAPHEQVWRQNKVKLVSRNILPGEVVRRLVHEKETQRGYCKSTKKTFTVQIVGTDKIIEHVSCNRLQNIRPFEVDDAVCLKSKFGRVEGVDQEITMISKCGSIVQILTSINNDLEDFWLVKKNRGSFEVCHPGQELVVVPSNLEQPLWIKKSKAMKRNMQSRQRFTVQTVKDCIVEVSWFSGCDGENTMSELKDEELKDLKVLEHGYDHFDSRKLLKISSSDVLMKKKNWIQKQTTLYKHEIPKVKLNSDNKSATGVSKMHTCIHQNSVTSDNSDLEEEWCTDEDEESEPASALSSKTLLNEKLKKKHYPPRPEELLPGNTVAVEVITMDAKATVVWQDGTEEANIPSTQLYYSLSLDDHEFVPGEWVTYNEKEAFPKNKYGVVQYANYAERIAMVKWFEYNEIDKTPTELPSSEMSVYDLKKHSKFLFRPGMVVRAKPIQEYKMGKVIDSSPKGYIIVKWIDGTEENCGPHDIVIIPETSEYELSDEEDTDSKGQLSWETESIESFTGGDITDETTLQNMAARLDFIRNRIKYFKEAFKKHIIQENLMYLKDLLIVYDNSSYLDKLLGTSFFSLKSKHFQVLLTHAKEKAKLAGVEFRGRLFVNDNLYPSMTKIKAQEKENIQKVLKLEIKVNTQMEEKKLATDGNPEPDESQIAHNNLCIELLSMLKLRMDLAYAEIISKIGGEQALTIITQASEDKVEPITRTPLPSMPVTPEDSSSSLSPPKLMSSTTHFNNEAYYALEDAPVTHHFYSSKLERNDQQRFLKAVQKEYFLLSESLPPGVWVRSFGNRIDLLSVMIEGPTKTPYEDGLFMFDMQFSQDYPRSPPLVHYVSYSSERLNPNLYVEGKVCVSLLGTWMGKGTEVWGPSSTLLQLIVSIQGLILVPEPYYNEAGYEKQVSTQQGYENSRTYNELVILKLVQSMTEMLLSPPEVFKQIVYSHFALKGNQLCQRLQKYCIDDGPPFPEFPLLPVSKGLKLSLTSALDSFQETLKKVVSNNIGKFTSLC